MRRERTDIRAVNDHSTLLRVIETRYQVRKGRLTATRLPDEGDRLAFRNGEINIAQHLTFCLVGKRDVIETYLFLKHHGLGLRGFDDVRLRVQHRINALQRSQAATDTVRRFAQVLGGVDDGVEDDEVIDERRCIDGRVLA